MNNCNIISGPGISLWDFSFFLLTLLSNKRKFMPLQQTSLNTFLLPLVRWTRTCVLLWNGFYSDAVGFGSSHFVDSPPVSQSVRKAFVSHDHWDVIPMTVCAHRTTSTYWERTKGKQCRCQLSIRSMLSPYIWRSKQSETASCIKISSSWQNRQTKHSGPKGPVLQKDVSLKVKQHVCLQISVSSVVLLL